jgi:hypothetical protein
MRALPWLLSMGLLLLACAGPAFDGRVYRSADISFRVGPQPEPWRKIQVEGALLAFRDPAGATIALNGRCGMDGDDVPLRALTHHLFLQFTARHVLDQRELVLDGREALRTELLAELDGVPRRFIVYVLKKNECVYDFLWIGLEHPHPDSVAAFGRFVEGFSTEI